VDAMEKAARRETQDRVLLEAIVREEYNLLMGYCLSQI
jgi:hypothetical protein